MGDATMTVLQGPRVRLRPLREEEFDTLWTSSQRWLEESGSDMSREDAQARVRERIADSGAMTTEGIDLAIELDGRLVGDIQARTNPKAMPPGVLELGIELFDPQDRGQGLGAEAVALLSAYAFGHLEAHRVQLGTDLENVSMRRVAERLGFVFEGTMRAFMPAPDGPRDYALYAITRDDYAEVKSRWI
jgi:RimJ/RimL family protein N-acetyltransferase